MKPNFLFKSLIALLLFGTSQSCLAHFAWVTTDSENRALLFFGESPDERAYKLPESLLKAKVNALTEGKKHADVKLVEVDEEDFIGRRSAEPVNPRATLATSLTYGNYHGTLLKYYAYHAGQVATDPPRLTQEPSEQKGSKQKVSAAKPQAGLEVIPSVSQRGLCLTVLWQGKPLEGVEATLMVGDGESEKSKSDRDGEAWFPPPVTGGGETQIAAIVGHEVDKEGTVDGEPYNNESHYATITFMHTNKEGNTEPREAATSAAANTHSAYPPVAEPVTSFGAAVSDGWLYVYSGHTGAAHSYSREELSTHFQRLNLSGGSAWEDLPCPRPLQGLAAATYDGKIYRVGGLEARNADGDEADLHSVADFAVYDPKTKTWTDLPALPAARSSHDVVVIDGTMYVVGGWNLTGETPGEWQGEILTYDLSQESGSWRPLEVLKLKRRALSVGEHEGKLVIIGGMNEDNDITQKVTIYDPATGQVSDFAEFPGSGMDGFGTTAINQGGQLYANGLEGVVYRLDAAGQAWQPVGELQQPRFFHQLVPGPGKALLAVAGTSDVEHLGDIEVLEVAK
ncbi:kelch repeat domain-containing protein [Adhaeretor mobilis]|uniref:N-acetylneuraminate epimerase n=1 Tax=Adhaeretor mobilis TaxID=1930276 RepID=A0A517N2L5_9BACT|nr:hypothetical protein [Adhaeretor mobilis]QDT01371.1 N-acetylneuraminate epimerase [Adhaeretor mobilis]